MRGRKKGTRFERGYNISNDKWSKLYKNYAETYRKKEYGRGSKIINEMYSDVMSFEEFKNEFQMSYEKANDRRQKESRAIITKMVQAQTRIYWVTDAISITDTEGKGYKFANERGIRQTNSLYIHLIHCIEEANDIANDSSNADKETAVEWLLKYSYLVKWSEFKAHISDALTACQEIEELQGYDHT